jgi:hypothetical protein
MGRLRHRTELPAAPVSARSMRAAQALSDSLLDTGELPPLPGSLPGLQPGELALRQWVGPRGAIFARDFTKFRHWRQLGAGGAVIIDVTSQRLRVTPGAENVPLRWIRRLEPRARDLSVLDLKLRTGDRLRLWGENVPELTVMLAWVKWRRVVAVPDREGGGSPAPFSRRATSPPVWSI